MWKGVPSELCGSLAEQGRSIGLRHRRRRVFICPGTFERISAGLNLSPSASRLAARAAELIELVVEGFELIIGDSPVLHGHVVIGDRLFTVALLVVALGQKVGGQKAPDLAVPMHTPASAPGP